MRVPIKYQNVVFGPGCKYAVVLDTYYGRKGYTTHGTEDATIAVCHRLRNYPHTVIDVRGNTYTVKNNQLVPTSTK